MAKKSAKSTTAVPLGTDDEWRARNDADSLRRAAEVMADGTRMREAKRIMHREMRGMQKMMGTGQDNSLGFSKGKK